MPPLFDQPSRQIGRREDNATKTTKTNNRSDKVLGRLLSIRLWHQDHGTINQFPWILIELEHPEGIGEDEEEVHEGTWPEWMTLEPREGYRVCVSIAGNKDILLAIAPLSRNTPICTLHNLSIGAWKTMKAMQVPPWWNPSIDN